MKPVDVILEFLQSGVLPTVLLIVRALVAPAGIVRGVAVLHLL